jgi:DNA-binding transcriptional regulator YdaS (Cro superfamily)
MEPSKQTLPETNPETDPRIIACKLAKASAGGARALAAHLGIKRQAVINWSMVPPRRCPKVEQVTGIPREVLRPDIFGKTEAAALTSADA